MMECLRRVNEQTRRAVTDAITTLLGGTVSTVVNLWYISERRALDCFCHQ